MRKRIGTKIYDTDKAVLVDTTPEGIQVYRKTGRSQEVFLYNPYGKNKHEMFIDLPDEESEKYINHAFDDRTKTYRSGAGIQLARQDVLRIKQIAHSLGMSIPKFILMLVDRYEAEHNEDRSE